MKQKTLPPVVPELLIERMTSLARERSIPVIPPTRNNPFLQFGQGIHGRRFSGDTLRSLQARLVAGKSLAFGQWLDQEFPRQQDGSRGRIPTVGITGSVGKTTTVQMVAAILREAGKCVALCTTQGAWIDEQRLLRGDLAGGSVPLELMRSERVDFGVFELARGGLIKFGMALDQLNIGAVLNIRDNHLGLNGVNSREDLARVKRIVVERATNLAVLNADDPLCMAMIPFLKSRKLALVSLSGSNREVLSHQGAGGMVIFQEGDTEASQIVLVDKGVEYGRMNVTEIPDSFGGWYTPAAINASFAIAIAQGFGIPFEESRKALSRYSSSITTNPGRNNFYKNLPFSLLLTRASSPEAAEAVANLVAKTTSTGRRRLLLSCVGDRPNFFIEGIARAVAGHFSEYLCTDFRDLRGRSAGEVAALISKALQEAGVPSSAIRTFTSPGQASEAAYQGLCKDDLLVDCSLEDTEALKWIMSPDSQINLNQDTRR